MVAKTLLRQFGNEVEAAYSPFQFALSTHAGVDSVGHVVRAMTDADPKDRVVCGGDWRTRPCPPRGDDVQFAGSPWVTRVTAIRQLFLRVTFPLQLGGPTRTEARNLAARGRRTRRSFMPLLFSLAIHNALAAVKAQMIQGEFLFAFLGDLHVVAQPAKIRFVYNLLGARLHEGGGIQLHEGKTRTWNRGGLCPEGMQELGPEVRSPCGVKILGTLVGSPEFVARPPFEHPAERSGLRGRMRCAWWPRGCP